MQDPPRTRRQTRASILSRLLATTEGLHRPRLAAACRLTEGSISRILAELRAEGLVQEPRRPTPYPGGPSSIVTLNPALRVAALEFANDRLGFGIANLLGEVDTATRLPLPAGASAAQVAAAVAEAVDSLAGWCAGHGLAPRQLAVSIPGYRPGGSNPILAVDAAALRTRLLQAFPGVPLALCNTATAQAAIHLQGPGSAITDRHLFLYLGHGVGAAWVDPVEAGQPIRAVELGHAVVDPEGPACRCGHRGCLEAHASTAALASIAEVEEAALVAAGPGWPALTRMTARRQQALRRVLRQTGIALGNALNAAGPARLAVCGWPAALPPDLRTALEQGVDASLFGGFADRVAFLQPAMGQEPAAALAHAVHVLLRMGGLPPNEEMPAAAPAA
ncbi:ROK family protein [Falsiroseomonas tokyonensis]|uniref:ROK family protein n=1 Tax=Falsiroseomonas tokyonensis TaxID=430521 RepID=A0ABV7BYY4_9PROT|nr:ROK family protein [Falsiroseomonas tokyonensis]